VGTNDGELRVLNVRFLALALVAAVAAACVTTRAAPIPDVTPRCTEILNRGVFYEETLSCFPAVNLAVERRLCNIAFRTHPNANLAGFGYGSSVFGERLVNPQQHVDYFLRSDISIWKSDHCVETADHEALSWAATRALWDDIYAQLPISLVGPWRACTEARQEGLSETLHCTLIGSYDTAGENEQIIFSAWEQPKSWFDFGATLQDGLGVEGAECQGGEWKSGSRISSTRARTLHCRRRGRSAVQIRLVTTEGSCERVLPALTALPWRRLCQSSRRSTSGGVKVDETMTSESTDSPVSESPRIR
jgi:hypothetical protein